jgi:hypothetical protein
MSVIPVLGRLRQEDCEFEASLGSRARSCLKTKEKQVKSKKHTQCIIPFICKYRKFKEIGGYLETRGQERMCILLIFLVVFLPAECKLHGFATLFPEPTTLCVVSRCSSGYLLNKPK